MRGPRRRFPKSELRRRAPQRRSARCARVLAELRRKKRGAAAEELLAELRLKKRQKRLAADQPEENEEAQAEGEAQEEDVTYVEPAGRKPAAAQPAATQPAATQAGIGNPLDDPIYEQPQLGETGTDCGDESGPAAD
eukprot:gene46466-6349_t